MKNIPKNIYLQVGCRSKDIDFKKLIEVSWCENRTDNTDIKYVEIREYNKLKLENDDLMFKYRTIVSILNQGLNRTR